MKHLVSNENCIHAPFAGVTRMKTFLQPLNNARFDVRIHAPNFCDDQHLVASRTANAAVGLGGGHAPMAALVALGARGCALYGFGRQRAAQNGIRRAGCIAAAALAVDGFVASASGSAPAFAGSQGRAADQFDVRNARLGRHACQGDLVVCPGPGPRRPDDGLCHRRHGCNLPLGDGIARNCDRSTGVVGTPAGGAASFFTHASLRARHGQGARLRRHSAGRMVGCMATLGQPRSKATTHMSREYRYSCR